MKAWKLLAHGKILLIFDINPTTREVKGEMKLTMKKPMSKSEAQKYVDDTFLVTAS
jgi:hypothetical protein